MPPSSKHNYFTPGASKSCEDSPLIVVITGGLRGLGKALVSELYEKGFVVIRGQRSRPLPTVSSQTVCNVRDIKLDLADRTSVREFSEQLLDQLPYIDLLINNAAICPDDPPDAANANFYWRSVMEVNFFAPVALTERLLPLLQRSSKYSRVINISSGDGELSFFSPRLQRQLERLSICVTASQLASDVDTVVRRLLSGFHDIPIHNLIFNSQPAYKLSKAALNAYTRFAASRNRMTAEKEIAFLSVCPGDVDTDMADSDAVLISPGEAVHRLSPVLNVNARCKTGVFLRDGREIPW